MGIRARAEVPAGEPRVPTVTSVAAGPLALRAGTDVGERGAATAEAAVVLPLLVSVAVALVWLVALASTQVRVVDAARETARAAARGETDAAAVEQGRRVAPDGAQFQVTRSAEVVTVRVVAEVRGPGGLLAFLPAVPLSSEAAAAPEPGTGQGEG